MTSQPCQNGGSCVLNDPTTSIYYTRFRCKCRRGYQGLYCEKPVRSCRGHKTMEKMNNGIYYVIDANGDPFPVFCNFGSQRSWTLIQSYLGNRSYLENNQAVNEDDPTTILYRLSPSKMKSIREHSTIWRIRHGEWRKDECWDSTHVTIEVDEKTCTSCFVKKYAITKPKNPEVKPCNLQHDYESHECQDALLGGNIDYYGLYCCQNSSFHKCPSEQLVTKIWLGDA